jgi:hypothetical protein
LILQSKTNVAILTHFSPNISLKGLPASFKVAFWRTTKEGGHVDNAVMDEPKQLDNGSMPDAQLLQDVIKKLERFPPVVPMVGSTQQQQ